MAVSKSKPAAKASVKKDSSPHSRLNVRLSPEVKKRISRAAAMSGADLTEFAVAALNEKANEVIERHENLLLASDEFQFFLDVLDSGKAKKPSKRSLAAAETYRRGKRKGVRFHVAD